LDGAANTTIQGNITLPALLNGGHQLTIYATDELGNEGFKTVYFDIAPFPTTTVVAVVVIIIIILLTGFLFFNRKRFEKKATGETTKNYEQNTLNKKPAIQEGSQN
jgi:heme/copper-type cytochrome/quinol oxidase subunit 2